MKHQKIYLILFKILILKYFYIKIRNLCCYYLLYYDLQSFKATCIITKNIIFTGALFAGNGIILRE